MNVFRFEMKQQRWSIVSWSAALSIVLLFFLSLYPMFSQSAANFKDLLQNYPQWLLDALNLNIDRMTTFFGYFPFALTYTALIGTIGAAYFGMGIVSRENREKTSDFLLSKPATRVSVITQKLLAVLCSLIIINVVFVVTSILWSMIFANGFDVVARAHWPKVGNRALDSNYPRARSCAHHGVAQTELDSAMGNAIRIEKRFPYLQSGNSLPFFVFCDLRAEKLLKRWTHCILTKFPEVKCYPTIAGFMHIRFGARDDTWPRRNIDRPYERLLYLNKLIFIAADPKRHRMVNGCTPVSMRSYGFKIIIGRSV